MKKSLLTLAACSLVSLGSSANAADGAKDWGYTAAEGTAAAWEHVAKECAHGHEQSPINISQFMKGDLPDLQLSYNPTPLHVVNNGHTIQANYGDGSGMTVGNDVYYLKQLHFHTPSEHYLDGAPYPMEVHFVHMSHDGELAVVGAMMKVGANNQTIDAIWQNIPAAGGEKHIESVEISAADLLPASLDYYAYEGSLTTPPCSEGVKWHVLKEPIELSAAQLTAFQQLFPVNARPIQALHGRVVEGD